MRGGCRPAITPQTDGQMERLNQTLEGFLPCYSSFQQGDWVELLPLAEYADNNRVCVSMGATRFQITQGIDRKPLSECESPTKGPADLIQWWGGLTEQWDLIGKSLDMAKEQYKRFADKKRAPGLDLKPGDFVYISTHNLKRTQPSKKLVWKYLGPFQVLDCINDMTVK